MGVLWGMPVYSRSRVIHGIGSWQMWRFILASAGYDGHKDDLLVPTVQLSTDCYDWLSTKLVELSHELCDGRLVVALEGGYDLPSLSRGVQGLILAMKGQRPHN